MSQDSNAKDSPSLIGQILVALGKINKQQLMEALELHSKSGQDSAGEKKPLGQVLLELGHVEPNDIIEAIRIQVQMRSEKPSAN